MKQYRTARQAAVEIKAADPNTAITEWFIRELLRDNAIPHIRVGNKYLLSLETLEKYLIEREI